jgi:hypothetical protein
MRSNVNQKIKTTIWLTTGQSEFLENHFTVFCGIWENYNYNGKIVLKKPSRDDHAITADWRVLLKYF